jgi:hypothetical protein
LETSSPSSRRARCAGAGAPHRQLDRPAVQAGDGRGGAASDPAASADRSPDSATRKILSMGSVPICRTPDRSGIYRACTRAGAFCKSQTRTTSCALAAVVRCGRSWTSRWWLTAERGFEGSSPSGWWAPSKNSCRAPCTTTQQGRPAVGARRPDETLYDPHDTLTTSRILRLGAESDSGASRHVARIAHCLGGRKWDRTGNAS